MLSVIPTYEIQFGAHYAGLNYRDAVDVGYEDYLDDIKSYLEEKPNIQFKGQTKVAINFNYKLCEGGDLDIDLLLSPYWESKEALYADLEFIQPPIKRLM